jgi:hypothetical protein
MSQLPDRPDPGQVREAGQAVTSVLTAGARELIDGQYADRSHLRPVLDAVLAALPGLGPVTVQARTTLVSLVAPAAPSPWCRRRLKARYVGWLRLRRGRRAAGCARRWLLRCGSAVPRSCERRAWLVPCGR